MSQDTEGREIDPATHPDRIFAERLSMPITGGIFFATPEEEAEHDRQQAEELERLRAKYADEDDDRPGAAPG